MGIPAFYKWVLDRFPRAVMDAHARHGFDFDNLYLDMNGIIHPCFHPQGLPAPKTYEEVFQSVFKYLDRIFSIVKPRKLLYLAIDGVAPRAKMNQQRSRRFRAAKDAAEEAAQKGELEDVSKSIEKSTSELSSKLDSNVITPGTEFMALLSSALRYYIHLRMNGDPGWQGIKVILSDANVPGEGEHKIMSYIRLQRNLPGFDPNTRHCLYGLDADLIMLALASHEIHFSILREDVQRSGFKEKSSKSRKKSSKSRRDSSKSRGKLEIETLDDYILNQRFQFLHIWILREYLAYAMKIPNPTVSGDLERLIDDFVFMCLFVGNDFLPHMPSLEISEGAIDLLMTIYKKEFLRMGGYLTSSFEVNLERVKHFLEAVGSHEVLILKKRTQVQKEWAIRHRRSSQNKIVGMSSVCQDSINSSAIEIQAPNNSASSTTTAVDKIKFGEEGWKVRYYAEKFEAETEDDREKVRKDVVLKYTEGICWVMHYYYEGVSSWQWFYPYHYAPFPSDFVGVDELKIQFTLGEPFKPFDQLMAVLPAASAHALPLFYRKLMTDASSPLLAFYPTDFELDMNGKRFSWQAICKLPFIDETSLLSEIARVENTLTDEERQRNNLGMDVLFVHISYPLAMEIVSFYRKNIDDLKLTNAEVKWKINPKFSGGTNGYILISDKPMQPLQIDSPIDGMEMIADNQVLSMFYECPPLHIHIPRPPEGVQYPGKTIRKKHVKPAPLLWHEKSAVVGRLHSIGPIRKSISGSRLAKSARLLVSKWYLEIEKKQKSKGDVEHGEGATIDGSHAGVDGEISGKTRKRKRKSTPKLKGKQNGGSELSDIHVGENGPASISNTGEAASLHGTRHDKSCSNRGAGGDSKCISGIHVGENRPASISNTGEAVCIDDIRVGKSCSNNGGAGGDIKRIVGTTVGEIGAESISNAMEAVSVDCTRGDGSSSNGGDGTCINGEAGGGLPELNLCDDRPASILILGEIASVGNNGGDGGDGKSNSGKSGRKQSSGFEVSNVVVGADIRASILNIGETSVGVNGDNGGDGKPISSKSRRRKRRKQSTGGVLSDVAHASGLASTSNVGETISEGDMGVDMHCSNDWHGEQAVGVLDKNLGGDESNLPIEGGNCIDRTGTADSRVGEDGLTCHLNPISNLCETTSAGVDGDHGGDVKSVSGKSKRRKRKRKRSSGVELPDVTMDGDVVGLISNVGETISAGDKGNDCCGKQAVGVLDNNLGGDELNMPIKGGNETNGNCIGQNGMADSHVGEDGSTFHLNPISDLDETTSAGVNGDVGDGKSISAKSKRRKRKTKQSGGVELPAVAVDANGLALISNVGQIMSAGDTGDDKRCSTDWPENAAVGILDDNLGGDESNMPVVSGNETQGNCIALNGITDGHVGEDGLTLHLNSISGLGKTACAGVSGNVGDGKSIGGKSKRRKWKRKQSSGVELPAVSKDGNGPALISNVVQTIFAGNMGDDKRCSNGWPGKQAVGILDNNLGGNVSNMPIGGGNETNGNCIDRNEIADSHIGEDGLTFPLSSVLNVGQKTSAGVNGDDGGDGQSISGKRKRRKRKRKQGTGVELPAAAIDANGLALISNVGQSVSATDMTDHKHCSNDWPEIQAVGVLDNNLCGDEPSMSINGVNETSGSCIDGNGIVDG